MENSIFSFEIKWNNGEFKVSGTEEFVNSKLDEFSEILKGKLTTTSEKNNFQMLSVPRNFESSVERSALPSIKPESGLSAEVFELIFAESEDGLKIISDIPGKNKADKIKHTAFILLYGNHLKGKEYTTKKELMTCCQEHGCMDVGNFASIINSLKPKHILSTDKNKTLKLTKPGQIKAQEVIQSVASLINA